jgi:hypothetical protein
MLIIGPVAIGAALGVVAIIKYWPYIVGFLAFTLIVRIISAIVRSGQYVCRQCGHKFTP